MIVSGKDGSGWGVITREVCCSKPITSTLFFIYHLVRGWEGGRVGGARRCGDFVAMKENGPKEILSRIAIGARKRGLFSEGMKVDPSSGASCRTPSREGRVEGGPDATAMCGSSCYMEITHWLPNGLPAIEGSRLVASLPLLSALPLPQSWVGTFQTTRHVCLTCRS